MTCETCGLEQTATTTQQKTQVNFHLLVNKQVNEGNTIFYNRDYRQVNGALNFLIYLSMHVISQR